VVVLPDSSVFGGDGDGDGSINNGRSSSSLGSLGRGLPEVASSLSVSLGLPSPGVVGGEEGGGVAGPSTSRTTDMGGEKGDGDKERERQRERSGLTRKSRSKGVSLRSEGSRSDYAVFI
jgi:axial budding pattern protein 2